MEIKKIMVLGAGLMGGGIAQVAGQNGFEVILNDTAPEFVERGFKAIIKSLEGQVKKEKITLAQKDETLGRITQSSHLEDAKQADFVIEAVYENFEVKKTLFQKLDEICREEIVFASNTSSIPITS
ncbi:MAG: 3-hydroxybutyryl-CoA dehydrogenase, partial [Desulfobacca sp.]|nr:3-hydroxybutyryl-CoA dehydrogenase [Desulfobacca sp.]